MMPANTAYPKAPEHLPYAVQHEIRVTAHPEAGDPVSLDIESGSLEVAMSEDWAPYCQIRATLPVPNDAVLLDRVLDPRRRVDLRVEAGYTYPGGHSESALLAVGGLRERPVSRPANTLALDAGGSEYRAQDDKAFWMADMDRRGITEAITWLAGRIEPSRRNPVVRSELPAGYGAAALADLEVRLGDEHWSVMSEAAAVTDTRVFCDETGVWRVTRRRETAGVPVHRLEVGEAGTITGSEANLTLDNWYNAVVLRYRWRDAAGVERASWGRAAVSTGPLSVHTVGFRTHVEDIDRPSTTARAHAAAATKLRTLVTRGRTRTITAAAAYWLRPSDTVSVVLPTGAEELHLVQSVRFNPLQGLMTVVTRQPENVQITNGE